MPEESNDEYDHYEEMGSFEELVAEKLPTTESARHFASHARQNCTYRIELWDAKVSQAWQMMATMPVQ